MDLDATERTGVAVTQCDSVGPNVVSTTSKLSLTTLASFGDAVDIFRVEKEATQPGDGSTINFSIDVRRGFEVGQYVMHILETNCETKEKVAILCLDELCAVKIHDRLNSSNMGQDFRAGNYLSRYDWMHMVSPLW